MSAIEALDELEAHDFLELACQVAVEHRVSVVAMCSHDRHKALVWPRFAFWYALRHHEERCLSYQDIARLVGFNHTSIIYGIKQHTLRLAAARAPRKAIAAAVPFESARCA